jgi:heavy-metal exporter, HME family
MFNFLVAQALKQRIFVLIAAAALILYGGLTASRLTVDVLPDLNKPVVTVMTEIPGLAPPEVEQLVTVPIEAGVNGLPGVTRVRSVSSAGLSIVYVEFDWGTDVFRNRQQVGERLALAASSLPPGAEPHIAPLGSLMGQILMVGLSGGDLSPMELRELADFTIRPRLLAIAGVSQVIPMGGEVRQYQVTPNLASLRALGISVTEVQAALEGFGANSGGGFVDQNAREFLIRTVTRTLSLDDLSNVVVATRDGEPVLLRQVAEISFAPKQKRGDAGLQGEDAVLLTIQKQPEADTLKVTRAVEAALKDLESALPEGVTASRSVFRMADFIETSIGNLQKVLIEAVAVVAFVLFAFLLNGRTTLISLAAIPMSLLITAVVFDLAGLSIDTMTLGGIAIAIGALVDDAVVDVENILRRLRENWQRPTPKPVFEIVVAASQEVRSGIMYATAVMVLVFAPLFALSGIEGRLFTPLGIAYIVALGASLIVSITLTPVLCYYFLPALKGHGGHDGALVRTLKRANRAALGWAFGRQGLVVASAGLAVILAGFAAMQLPRAFLPAFNEGSLTVFVTFRPGLALADSAAAGAQAEKLIAGIPGVETVARRTGRAELDEHAEGVHLNELEVRYDRDVVERDDLSAEIREKLAAFPAGIGVGQPLSHRIDHMLAGVQAQLTVKLFGEDIDSLRTLAEGLSKTMAGIPGLVDVRVETQVRIPEIEIRIDYARAAQYGVQPAAVARAVEELTAGARVSEVIDGLRRFDVVLRLPDAQRQLQSLGDLLIETPSGHVPLSSLADVRESDGPNQIGRENGKRRIAILANTDGSDLEAIGRAVNEAVRDAKLPKGVFALVEGQFQAQAEASRTIAILGLIAAAMIFTILYMRYRSMVLALIVMTTIPLALIGAVVALALAGESLSVASLVGFIALAGIAARNGILKISHYLNLALYEGERFGQGLVLRGSLERMTPVLMTALSAGLALVPLILAGGDPGMEILYPVAVTIFGGLVSATLLDALLTPVLFLMFGERELERLRAQSEASGLKEAF